MADTTIMRRTNLQSILETIDRLGSATTAELAEHTALSPATISRVTVQLKAAGLILQDRVQTSEPGRKPELYRLNAAYGTGLYFNLKSGCLQGYLMDFGGRVLAQTELPVGADLTVDDLLQMIAAQRQTLQTKKSMLPPPLAVCLTLPGQQDRSNATVCRIPNFPRFEGTALQQAITDALGLPCLVRNTARLTAWGHFLARRRNVRNLVYMEITEDCGIGAGLVLGGRLYEDELGLSGEIGDMIVQLKNRNAVENRGALEEDAGMQNLFQKAHALLPQADLRALELSAEAGNDDLLQLLSDTARCWTAAIINLCAILSPDKIVLGGAVSEENTLIRNLIDRHLKALYHRPVSLAFAPRGCLCHAEGAGDLLKAFLFEQELNKITE